MDTTLLEAGRLLADAESIVIATHVMPDGDGLGAEAALYHYLKRLGKKVRILNPDPMPDRYQFLNRGDIYEVFDESAVAELARRRIPIDLAIIVDTNDPKRIGKVWKHFEANAKEILIFDHHPHPEVARKPKVHTVVDVRSSSIGELLFRLFNAAHDLLDRESATFKLLPEIAEGLYVSIVTDTNSFRYARTTALSHRIAADLIDYGLQPEEIYQNVYSTKSVEHLRLFGEVLAKVQEQRFKNSQASVAWVEIPKALRQKHGASSDDTQSIVNYLLLIKQAEILVLFREEDDGRIKVSLKSKSNRQVNHIAQEFGGGGHDFAAGFTVSGNIAEVRERLIRRLLD